MFEGEKMVEVQFRCPQSMNTNISAAVDMLKKQGFDADRSKVIRAILDYRAGNMAQIAKMSIQKAEKAKEKAKKGK